MGSNVSSLDRIKCKLTRPIDISGYKFNWKKGTSVDINSIGKREPLKYCKIETNIKTLQLIQSNYITYSEYVPLEDYVFTDTFLNQTIPMTEKL